MKKTSSRSSKTFNFNRSGFKLINTGNRLNGLKLSKIDGMIPVRAHREIEGKVKGMTMKREETSKWHAIFQVEDAYQKQLLPSKTGKAVSIDVA